LSPEGFAAVGTLALAIVAGIVGWLIKLERQHSDERHAKADADRRLTALEASQQAQDTRFVRLEESIHSIDKNLTEFRAEFRALYPVIRGERPL
jgi:hypothetical protein